MLLGALAGGSVATLAPGGGLLRLAVAAALGATLGSRLSGDAGSSALTTAPPFRGRAPSLWRSAAGTAAADAADLPEGSRRSVCVAVRLIRTCPRRRGIARASQSFVFVQTKAACRIQ